MVSRGSGADGRGERYRFSRALIITSSSRSENFEESFERRRGAALEIPGGVATRVQFREFSL